MSLLYTEAGSNLTSGQACEAVILGGSQRLAWEVSAGPANSESKFH